MKKLTNPGYLILFLLILYSITFAQTDTKSFSALGYDCTVEGEFKGFDVKVDSKKIADNLEIVTITLTSTTPAEPPEFDVKWSLPAPDILGQWNSASYFDKTINADWWPSRVKSMMASNAPVLTLFGSDDSNKLTYAVSDGLNKLTLSCGIREEDGRIYCKINFLSEKHKKVTEYKTEIRFDNRPVKFYKALLDIALWWESFESYKPAHVPEHAKLPMYSTWYSYHQSVSADALLKECEIAKKMGFESIIIDDGWQTLDSKRGYAFTGDWEPERIPDMKEFVDGVHDRGMKFLLWYSVSLVGEKSKIYEKF